jgi:hypothetical protein
MASTATTVLRLEKQANGENTGTWGTKQNVLHDMVDLALSGVAISTTGGTTTLTNVDYTADQAKAETLDISGTLVSNATIVIPNAKKKYIVVNGTSGAFTLTVKTSSGSGIEVTQGSSATIYCDGSNVVRYVTPITVLTTGAPATSSGAAASSVSVTPTGNLSSSNAQAAFAELQTDIDTVNTSLGNKQPLDADLTAIAALAATKGNSMFANGTTWAAVAVGSNGLVLRAASGQSSGVEWSAGVPSGTISVFQQTAAPTGYTKNTTHNNKAMRVVSGTASSGGSTAFTSVFTTRTIAANNLPNITLTVTDPGHDHGYTAPANQAGGDGGGSVVDTTTAGTTDESTTGISVAIDNTARGGVAQQTMDFAVQYVDFIVATAS